MKRLGIIMLCLTFFVGSSLLAAEVSSLKAAKVQPQNDMNQIIVPIELNNTVPMAALDMPLKFTEGVVLDKVLFEFEGSRSADFDFKHANIDNEARTVVIGMIPMVYGDNSDLAVGSGAIAQLVFSVVDPSIEEFEISPTTMDRPSHSLMLVYSDSKSAIDMAPEFGTINVSVTKGNPDDLVPPDFKLAQNSPNPFNPTTGIDYALPKATNVRLDVFNVLGQQVRTLVNEFQDAGHHSIIWDGLNNSGSSVATGVYFYRLTTDEHHATKKMLMLK